MIIVVSPCFFFKEGFKSLIEELNNETQELKDIFYTDDVRKISKSQFASATTLVVDYEQPNINCLISLFERKNLFPNTYLILITRECCFENALENVLINTVADYTIDSNVAKNILTTCLKHLSKIVNRTTNCKERNLRLIELTHSLTKMETMLLPYIVSGKKNKEISRYVNVSDKLISHHRRNIYKKFAVDSIGGLYQAFDKPEKALRKE